MTMPIDFVLVRHGESEGNLANKLSREGINLTEEFRNRHSSQWRLTDKGIFQAEEAGKWIKRNIKGGVFDRYYVSEYIRAMETAARLDLPNAIWGREFYLRERDWGQLDLMSQEERVQRFAEELKRRRRDGFFWAPPGGESMASSCLRIEKIFDTLHRECSDKRIIIVCHGEVMLSFKVRLERMTQDRFYEIERSDDPHDQIHNGQIFHYTRRDPDTGKLAKYVNWFRSICPWNLSLSSNVWEVIERKKYNNSEILKEVEKIPRMLS
jgi:NAD+ kinase